MSEASLGYAKTVFVLFVINFMENFETIEKVSLNGVIGSHERLRLARTDRKSPSVPRRKSALKRNPGLCPGRLRAPDKMWLVPAPHPAGVS